MIRTIVPPNISAESYRKAMITILFFRRIIFLSSSPSVTISDLTATVVASFAMPIGSVEREVQRIVESVRHAFFVVGNLRGIEFLDSWILGFLDSWIPGFLDSSGKPITVSDNRAADITLFSF